MLQDKLNECRILILDVSQNKQLDLENQNVARRNNTFFDAYHNNFIPTIESYISAKKYEGVVFSQSITDDIKKYMEESKQIFERKQVVNPSKYRDGVKKLSDNIAKEWNDQIVTILDEKKEELNVLKLVSNNKLAIQKILTCFNTFSKWPVSDDKLEQYKIAAYEADKILLEMEFDDEISVFLKKVKDKEATILDLSDSIIQWIRKEELSENIMLSIKNN